jgi:hypothetical protein
MEPVAYIDQYELDSLVDGFTAKVTSKLVYDDSHELIILTTELKELLESVSSWCEKVNDIKFSKASVGDTMKAMNRLYLVSKQFVKYQNNKEKY